jgi:hypothetical protein
VERRKGQRRSPAMRANEAEERLRKKTKMKRRRRRRIT